MREKSRSHVERRRSIGCAVAGRILERDAVSMPYSTPLKVPGVCVLMPIIQVKRLHVGHFEIGKVMAWHG